MAPTELTFWTVAEVTAEALPELRPQLEALVLDSFDSDQRPYPHWVLEDYLRPFVESAAREGRDADLARAFALVERIASHPDDDLVGALGGAFVDFLDADTLRRADPHLGSATRTLVGAWSKQVS